jgi:hypothetical protein
MLFVGNPSASISTGTVTLSAPSPAAVVISLSTATDVPGGTLTVPTSVTVPAGQSSNTFTMTWNTDAPFENGEATVTATLAGRSLSITLWIEGEPR